MRRRYLRKNLALKTSGIAKFAGFYATAPETQFWFLDLVSSTLRKKATKLKKSIMWLNRLIADCDKPEEERTAMFDIEAIKRVPIDSLIRVNRAGFFKIRNEKTPSTKWYKVDNRWHDFGSGEGGDVLDLYMKINNCDFRTACSELQHII